MKNSPFALIQFRLIPMFALCMLLSSMAVEAQSACPTNFDGDSLELLLENHNFWGTRLLAYEGVVKRVKELINGDLYVECELRPKGDVWALLPAKADAIRPFDVLRILGYVRMVGTENDEIIALNRDGFEVFGIAQINILTKQMTAIPGTNRQYNEWLKGHIPSGNR